MKYMNLILAGVFGIGATVAVAQTMVEDADGSGNYSMEELLTVYPALTDDVYAEIDTNQDGAVDAAELVAAQEAGILSTG